MVLQANYEATLLAAADHADGSGHVFLTFIGGGVFRNDMAWIVDAIAQAAWSVGSITSVQLVVHICHYREVLLLPSLFFKSSRHHNAFSPHLYCCPLFDPEFRR